MCIDIGHIYASINNWVEKDFFSAFPFMKYIPNPSFSARDVVFETF